MRVLLGVCGGIAAYKAAELTRELQARGAEVQVAMTESAERFITPLTLATLSGRPVLTSLWNPQTPAAGQQAETFDIEHIRIAQQVDCVLIAPATANMIAKLAHGMADDLLTAIALATTAPLVLAPAMNVNMWRHAATGSNVATLEARGARILAPASGYLACGMVGEGRLAAPAEIADAVLEGLATSEDLHGEVVLITTGGTQEAIDPVRYLGNRSSGRMGFALAAAALARGAEVLLVSAITSEPFAGRCEQTHVVTAAEMQRAVLDRLPRATIVIMAAAVADYRVDKPAEQKIKKTDTLTLELVRNDDILRQVVLRRRQGTLVAGFAAETQHVLEEGRRKLRDKGVDVIVANDVSQAHTGFGSEQNSGTLITLQEEVSLPLSSKRAMADRILTFLAAMRIVDSPLHIS